MSRLPRLLLVEDDVILGSVYQVFLANELCEINIVNSGQAALEAIEDFLPNIVFLDLLLPDIHGLAILGHIKSLQLPITVVVITSVGSVDMAVEAMHLGAFDYLLKPLDKDRLVTTLHNVLERYQLRQQLDYYETTLPEESFEQFVGGSSAMRVLYKTINTVASSDASVFIIGESGTGKELCAEAIHQRSKRGKGPFISINCAAIPRELMESELFGHAKGAFTGAISDHQGAVSLAKGGTLFFDEICEMDIELQAKLLRFIQTKRFQPVGGTVREYTDVRFIYATNRDPFSEVQAGRFREDLYYRLYVVPITLPPLRERDTDILLLAKHFLDELAQKEGKHFDGFSLGAERCLMNYDWPGNVRQLEHLVHNLVVLNLGGVIESTMLTLLSETSSPCQQQEPALTPTRLASQSGGSSADAEILPMWVEERRIIEQAISLCGGNIVDAAARLGISDSTIYRKRKKWSRMAGQGC